MYSESVLAFGGWKSAVVVQASSVLEIDALVGEGSMDGSGS